MRQRFEIGGRALLAAIVLCQSMAAAAPLAAAQENAAGNAEASAVAAFAKLIEGAQALGEGPAQLYAKDGSYLLAIAPAAFGRDILWYVEAARMPAEVVSSQGNAIGETLIRLERHGGKVFVRDLTGSTMKRAGPGPDQMPAPDGDANEASGADDRPVARGEAKLDPIQMAVSDTTLGPIIMALPVLAENDDGTILLDVTAPFSADVGGKLSAKSALASSGIPVIAADPGRSYIESARSYPTNIAIRSHLTFIDPTSAALSIVVGHSIVLLPEAPMKGRNFDPRVGFFRTSFVEFESGAPVSRGSHILRHRLEKPDPTSEAPADPVNPIVFHVGRGVPDRWRPYVKQGIEMWQPVFAAAGFTNAIVARDAPTPAGDPYWSPEDARHNVIRWLPQEFANAMGPVVYDPRSGEILAAHILLWPSVLDFFGTY